jgi:hypothetical protein
VTVVARRRLVAVVILAAVVVAVVVGVTRGGGDDGPRRFAPGLGDAPGTSDPLAYDDGARDSFEQRAAQGLAHVLYAKSPGGVPATVARVQALRPLIEDVARRAGQDADTLEAIVFLESGGRPDVVASSDLRSAAGLTQILAQTATGLLGLRVDVAASARLTRSIARSRSPGRRATFRARRRAVDERFDPRKALEATTRYLELAEDRLGRDDLAVVSYHMGIGNLQQALARYGDDDIPYAQLFFDSSPLRHARAWSFLASLGDDSSTYLWRIRAAAEVMRLSREGPAALRRQIALQASPAGEAVLRPPATPRAKRSELVLLDGTVLRPGQARLSVALSRAPAAQRALRPGAAALLRYLAAGVAEIAPGAPLVVTAAAQSTAQDTHATGFAFDISRAYASPAQAAAFQFWLDRLRALDVIAWTREPDTIHLTVGPRADRLAGALLPRR